MTHIPADYNLPDDYTFTMNSWGNSFYKIYQSMNYVDAKSQCESDGAYLATPRSDAENAFIAGLIPNQSIWIGVSDIDEEGQFISADGLDVTFTKWYQKVRQPDNYQHGNGNDEDGVQIVGTSGWEDSKGFWNDQQITNRYKFVCHYNIPAQVWHGESDVATITSNAGQYDETYGVENMFDDDYSDDSQVLWRGTYWFSDPNQKVLPKPIAIEFAEPIQFHELTILKRLFHENVYKNVCLILNSDVDNELCTDSPFGFDGANDKDSRFITWRKLTDGVKRIDLVFRDTSGDAYIADLKIFYNKSDKRTIETINGNKYEAILIENTKPATETWSGSKQLCEDYGFQLPVPDSDEMNNFLTNFAPDRYGEIHLGILSDTSEQNDVYKFSNTYTNGAISYSNWHRNEPNDGKNNDAVVGLIVNSHNWHGKWYDFSPTSKRGDYYKGRPVYHICMKKLPYEHNPLLTWHGEPDVATITNDGGEWDAIYGETTTYELGNLFDDDSESIWHSSKDTSNQKQTLTITFNSEIQFEELKIMKWSQSKTHYKYICLELNDDKYDRMCSWKEDGTTDARNSATTPGRYITFKRPTKDVKKISLSFNYYNHANRFARISDLKIQYRAKPKPNDFALPEGYQYFDSKWGKKFYKGFGSMTFTEARAQCESDGAVLAIPSSEEENQFLANFFPEKCVWIGVTDLEEEGNFKGVDGSELTFTKWYTNNGQPDNYNHNNGNDEDATNIIRAGHPWSNSQGYWNDQQVVNHKCSFVCSLAVKGSIIFY